MNPLTGRADGCARQMTLSLKRAATNLTLKGFKGFLNLTFAFFGKVTSSPLGCPP
jgi:hypothetical protein